MRICIVTFEYPPQIGGIAHAVNRIARGLFKKGIEVHVVAVSPNRFKSFSKNKSFFVHRFGPSSGDLKYISDKEAENLSNYLLQLDKKYSFDIFHAFTIFPCGYIVGKIAKQLGKPVVVSGRGEDAATDLKDKNLEEKRQTIKDADHLTFVSTEMRDYVDGFERCRDKSKVMLNCLDPSEFYYLPEMKTPELKGIVIGIATTIRETKGFEYLLEAFARFSKEYESTLLLVGSFRTDELKKKYFLLMHKLGIKNKVVITGKIKHKFILNYINLIDVYVLPSLFSEGCPNSLLEAMYLGKPVIGSRVGAIPEVIEDKKNGILVTSRSADEIYESLVMLKNNEALSNCIRTNAIKTILRNHNADKEPGGWLQLYKGHIKKKKIIMVMGVQRSGTTILLKCLSKDRNISTFNEDHSDFFKNYFLRPLSKIELQVRKINKLILLKPISETIVRSINDIFEEYKEYDVWIPWIYRDPVNVYYSHLLNICAFQKVDDFIDSWNKRNQKILSVLPKYGHKILIFRYEDIISSDRIFFELCQSLKINGQFLFGDDPSAGIKNLSSELKRRIYRGTYKTLAELNKNRFYFKSPSNLAMSIPPGSLTPNLPGEISYNK